MQSGQWLEHSVLSKGLDEPAASALSALRPQLLKSGTILFHPGMSPRGFPIVIDGRIGVYLTGKSGRELLLYKVTSGETCVQSTLGLLGQEQYSAEAITETDVVAVMVSPTLFASLMASSPAFRNFVFRAFATRVSDIMFMLEQVAFVRVENRLAALLLARADAKGHVVATHHDLAVAIGTVREVITRQLKALASRRLIALERGHIAIIDHAELTEISQRNG